MPSSPLPHPPIVNGTLSVIVPIYNEAATVRQSLDAILAKQVPGWTLQIILIESNSSDGTRPIVQTYAAHPRVKLLLEDRPRGKGHAEALAAFLAASGAGGGAPIPLDELAEVSRWSIRMQGMKPVQS